MADIRSWEDITADPAYQQRSEAEKIRTAKNYERYVAEKTGKPPAQRPQILAARDKEAAAVASGERGNWAQRNIYEPLTGQKDISTKFDEQQKTGVNDFSAQVGAGADSLQGSMYRLMAEGAEALGWKSSSAYAMKRAKNNEALAEAVTPMSTRDIHGVGDLLKFGLYGFGRSLPEMGAAMALSAVPVIGTGASLGMMAGAGYSRARAEQEKNDLDNPLLAATTGTLGALVGRMGLKAGGNWGGQIAQKTGKGIKGVVGQAVKGGLAETPEEIVQEGLESIGGGETRPGHIAYAAWEGGAGGLASGAGMGAGKGAFNVAIGRTEEGAASGARFKSLINVDPNARGRAKAVEAATARANMRLLIKEREEAGQPMTPEEKAALVRDQMRFAEGATIDAFGRVMADLQKDERPVDDNLFDDYIRKNVASVNEGLGLKASRAAASTGFTDHDRSTFASQEEGLDRIFKARKRVADNHISDLAELQVQAEAQRDLYQAQADQATTDQERAKLNATAKYWQQEAAQLSSQAVDVGKMFQKLSEAVSDKGALQSRRAMAIAYDNEHNTNLTDALDDAAAAQVFSNNLSNHKASRERGIDTRRGVMGVAGMAFGGLPAMGAQVVLSALGGSRTKNTLSRMTKAADFSKIQSGIAPVMSGSTKTMQSLQAGQDSFVEGILQGKESRDYYRKGTPEEQAAELKKREKVSRAILRASRRKISNFETYYPDTKNSTTLVYMKEAQQQMEKELNAYFHTKDIKHLDNFDRFTKEFEARVTELNLSKGKRVVATDQQKFEEQEARKTPQRRQTEQRIRDNEIANSRSAYDAFDRRTPRYDVLVKRKLEDLLLDMQDAQTQGDIYTYNLLKSEFVAEFRKARTEARTNNMYEKERTLRQWANLERRREVDLEGARAELDHFVKTNPGPAFPATTITKLTNLLDSAERQITDPETFADLMEAYKIEMDAAEIFAEVNGTTVKVSDADRAKIESTRLTDINTFVELVDRFRKTHPSVDPAVSKALDDKLLEMMQAANAQDDTAYRLAKKEYDASFRNAVTTYKDAYVQPKTQHQLDQERFERTADTEIIDKEIQLLQATAGNNLNPTTLQALLDRAKELRKAISDPASFKHQLKMARKELRAARADVAIEKKDLSPLEKEQRKTAQQKDLAKAKAEAETIKTEHPLNMTDTARLNRALASLEASVDSPDFGPRKAIFNNIAEKLKIDYASVREKKTAAELAAEAYNRQQGFNQLSDALQVFKNNNPQVTDFKELDDLLLDLQNNLNDPSAFKLILSKFKTAYQAKVANIRTTKKTAKEIKKAYEGHLQQYKEELARTRDAVTAEREASEGKYTDRKFIRETTVMHPGGKGIKEVILEEWVVTKTADGKYQLQREAADIFPEVTVILDDDTALEAEIAKRKLKDNGLVGTEGRYRYDEVNARMKQWAENQETFRQTEFEEATDSFVEKAAKEYQRTADAREASDKTLDAMKLRLKNFIEAWSDKKGTMEFYEKLMNTLGFAPIQIRALVQSPTAFSARLYKELAAMHKQQVEWARELGDKSLVDPKLANFKADFGSRFDTKRDLLVELQDILKVHQEIEGQFAAYKMGGDISFEQDHYMKLLDFMVMDSTDRDRITQMIRNLNKDINIYDLSFTESRRRLNKAKRTISREMRQASATFRKLSDDSKKRRGLEQDIKNLQAFLRGKLQETVDAKDRTVLMSEEERAAFLEVIEGLEAITDRKQLGQSQRMFTQALTLTNQTRKAALRKLLKEQAEWMREWDSFVAEEMRVTKRAEKEKVRSTLKDKRAADKWVRDFLDAQARFNKAIDDLATYTETEKQELRDTVETLRLLTTPEALKRGITLIEDVLKGKTTLEHTKTQIEIDRMNARASQAAQTQENQRRALYQTIEETLQDVLQKRDEIQLRDLLESEDAADAEKSALLLDADNAIAGLNLLKAAQDLSSVLNPREMRDIETLLTGLRSAPNREALTQAETLMSQALISSTPGSERDTLLESVANMQEAWAEQRLNEISPEDAIRAAELQAAADLRDFAKLYSQNATEERKLLQTIHSALKQPSRLIRNSLIREALEQVIKGNWPKAEGRELYNKFYPLVQPTARRQLSTKDQIAFNSLVSAHLRDLMASTPLEGWKSQTLAGPVRPGMKRLVHVRKSTDGRFTMSMQNVARGKWEISITDKNAPPGADVTQTVEGNREDAERAVDARLKDLRREEAFSLVSSGTEPKSAISDDAKGLLANIKAALEAGGKGKKGGSKSATLASIMGVLGTAGLVAASMFSSMPAMAAVGPEMVPSIMNAASSILVTGSTGLLLGKAVLLGAKDIKQFPLINYLKGRIEAVLGDNLFRKNTKPVILADMMPALFEKVVGEVRKSLRTKNTPKNFKRDWVKGKSAGHVLTTEGGYRLTLTEAGLSVSDPSGIVILSQQKQGVNSKQNAVEFFLNKVLEAEAQRFVNAVYMSEAQVRKLNKEMKEMRQELIRRGKKDIPALSIIETAPTQGSLTTNRKTEQASEFAPVDHPGSAFETHDIDVLSFPQLAILFAPTTRAEEVLKMTGDFQTEDEWDEAVEEQLKLTEDEELNLGQATAFKPDKDSREVRQVDTSRGNYTLVYTKNTDLGPEKNIEGVPVNGYQVAIYNKAGDLITEGVAEDEPGIYDLLEDTRLKQARRFVNTASMAPEVKKEIEEEKKGFAEIVKAGTISKPRAPKVAAHQDSWATAHFVAPSYSLFRRGQRVPVIASTHKTFTVQLTDSKGNKVQLEVDKKTGAPLKDFGGGLRVNFSYHVTKESVSKGYKKADFEFLKPLIEHLLKDNRITRINDLIKADRANEQLVAENTEGMLQIIDKVQELTVEELDAILQDINKTAKKHFTHEKLGVPPFVKYGARPFNYIKARVDQLLETDDAKALGELIARAKTTDETVWDAIVRNISPAAAKKFSHAAVTAMQVEKPVTKQKAPVEADSEKAPSEEAGEAEVSEAGQEAEVAPGPAQEAQADVQKEEQQEVAPREALPTERQPVPAKFKQMNLTQKKDYLLQKIQEIYQKINKIDYRTSNLSEKTLENKWVAVQKLQQTLADTFDTLSTDERAVIAPFCDNFEQTLKLENWLRPMPADLLTDWLQDNGSPETMEPSRIKVEDYDGAIKDAPEGTWLIIQAEDGTETLNFKFRDNVLTLSRNPGSPLPLYSISLIGGRKTAPKALSATGLQGGMKADRVAAKALETFQERLETADSEALGAYLRGETELAPAAEVEAEAAPEAQADVQKEEQQAKPTTLPPTQVPRATKFNKLSPKAKKNKLLKDLLAIFTRERDIWYETKDISEAYRETRFKVLDDKRKEYANNVARMTDEERAFVEPFLNGFEQELAIARWAGTVSDTLLEDWLESLGNPATLQPLPPKVVDYEGEDWFASPEGQWFWWDDPVKGRSLSYRYGKHGISMYRSKTAKAAIGYNLKIGSSGTDQSYVTSKYNVLGSGIADPLTAGVKALLDILPYEDANKLHNQLRTDNAARIEAKESAVPEAEDAPAETSTEEKTPKLPTTRKATVKKDFADMDQTEKTENLLTDVLNVFSARMALGRGGSASQETALKRRRKELEDKMETLTDEERAFVETHLQNFEQEAFLAEFSNKPVDKDMLQQWLVSNDISQPAVALPRRFSIAKSYGSDVPIGTWESRSVYDGYRGASYRLAGSSLKLIVSFKKDGPSFYNIWSGDTILEGPVPILDMPLDANGNVDPFDMLEQEVRDFNEAREKVKAEHEEHQVAVRSNPDLASPLFTNVRDEQIAAELPQVISPLLEDMSEENLLKALQVISKISLDGRVGAVRDAFSAIGLDVNSPFAKRLIRQLNKTSENLADRQQVLKNFYEREPVDRTDRRFVPNFYEQGGADRAAGEAVLALEGKTPEAQMNTLEVWLDQLVLDEPAERELIDAIVKAQEEKTGEVSPLREYYAEEDAQAASEAEVEEEDEADAAVAEADVSSDKAPLPITGREPHAGSDFDALSSDEKLKNVLLETLKDLSAEQQEALQANYDSLSKEEQMFLGPYLDGLDDLMNTADLLGAELTPEIVDAWLAKNNFPNEPMVFAGPKIEVFSDPSNLPTEQWVTPDRTPEGYRRFTYYSGDLAVSVQMTPDGTSYQLHGPDGDIGYSVPMLTLDTDDTGLPDPFSVAEDALQDALEEYEGEGDAEVEDQQEAAADKLPPIPLATRRISFKQLSAPEKVKALLTSLLKLRADESAHFADLRNAKNKRAYGSSKAAYQGLTDKLSDAEWDFVAPYLQNFEQEALLATFSDTPIDEKFAGRFLQREGFPEATTEKPTVFVDSREYEDSDNGKKWSISTLKGRTAEFTTEDGSHTVSLSFAPSGMAIYTIRNNNNNYSTVRGPIPILPDHMDFDELGNISPFALLEDELNYTTEHLANVRAALAEKGQGPYTPPLDERNESAIADLEESLGLLVDPETLTEENLEMAVLDLLHVDTQDQQDVVREILQHNEVDPESQEAKDIVRLLNRGMKAITGKTPSLNEFYGPVQQSGRLSDVVQAFDSSEEEGIAKMARLLNGLSEAEADLYDPLMNELMEALYVDPRSLEARELYTDILTQYEQLEDQRPAPSEGTDTRQPLPEAPAAPAAEPDAAEPDAAEPDAAEPDAAEPDAAEPDAAPQAARKPVPPTHLRDTLFSEERRKTLASLLKQHRRADVAYDVADALLEKDPENKDLQKEEAKKGKTLTGVVTKIREMMGEYEADEWARLVNETIAENNAKKRIQAIDEDLYNAYEMSHELWEASTRSEIEADRLAQESSDRRSARSDQLRALRDDAGLEGLSEEQVQELRRERVSSIETLEDASEFFSADSRYADVIADRLQELGYNFYKEDIGKPSFAAFAERLQNPIFDDTDVQLVRSIMEEGREEGETLELLRPLAMQFEESDWNDLLVNVDPEAVAQYSHKELTRFIEPPPGKPLRSRSEATDTPRVPLRNALVSGLLGLYTGAQSTYQKSSGRVEKGGEKGGKSYTEENQEWDKHLVKISQAKMSRYVKELQKLSEEYSPAEWNALLEETVAAYPEGDFENPSQFLHEALGARAQEGSGKTEAALPPKTRKPRDTRFNAPRVREVAKHLAGLASLIDTRERNAAALASDPQSTGPLDALSRIAQQEQDHLDHLRELAKEYEVAEWSKLLEGILADKIHADLITARPAGYDYIKEFSHAALGVPTLSEAKKAAEEREASLAKTAHLVDAKARSDKLANLFMKVQEEQEREAELAAELNKAPDSDVLNRLLKGSVDRKEAVKVEIREMAATLPKAEWDQLISEVLETNPGLNPAEFNTLMYDHEALGVEPAVTGEDKTASPAVSPLPTKTDKSQETEAEPEGPAKPPADTNELEVDEEDPKFNQEKKDKLANLFREDAKNSAALEKVMDRLDARPEDEALMEQQDALMESRQAITASLTEMAEEHTPEEWTHLVNSTLSENPDIDSEIYNAEEFDQVNLGVLPRVEMDEEEGDDVILTTTTSTPVAPRLPGKPYTAIERNNAINTLKLLNQSYINLQKEQQKTPVNQPLLDQRSDLFGAMAKALAGLAERYSVENWNALMADAGSAISELKLPPATLTHDALRVTPKETSNELGAEPEAEADTQVGESEATAQETEAEVDEQAAETAETAETSTTSNLPVTAGAAPEQDTTQINNLAQVEAQPQQETTAQPSSEVQALTQQIAALQAQVAQLAGALQNPAQPLSPEATVAAETAQEAPSEMQAEATPSSTTYTPEGPVKAISTQSELRETILAEITAANKQHGFEDTPAAVAAVLQDLRNKVSMLEDVTNHDVAKAIRGAYPATATEAETTAEVQPQQEAEASKAPEVDPRHVRSYDDFSSVEELIDRLADELSDKYDVNIDVTEEMKEAAFDRVLDLLEERLSSGEGVSEAEVMFRLQRAVHQGSRRGRLSRDDAPVERPYVAPAEIAEDADGDVETEEDADYDREIEDVYSGKQRVPFRDFDLEEAANGKGLGQLHIEKYFKYKVAELDEDTPYMDLPEALREDLEDAVMQKQLELDNRDMKIGEAELNEILDAYLNDYANNPEKYPVEQRTSSILLPQLKAVVKRAARLKGVELDTATANKLAKQLKKAQDSGKELQWRDADKLVTETIEAKGWEDDEGPLAPGLKVTDAHEESFNALTDAFNAMLADGDLEVPESFPRIGELAVEGNEIVIPGTLVPGQKRVQYKYKVKIDPTDPANAIVTLPDGKTQLRIQGMKDFKFNGKFDGAKILVALDQIDTMFKNRLKAQDKYEMAKRNVEYAKANNQRPKQKDLNTIAKGEVSMVGAKPTGIKSVTEELLPVQQPTSAAANKIAKAKRDAPPQNSLDPGIPLRENVFKTLATALGLNPKDLEKAPGVVELDNLWFAKEYNMPENRIKYGIVRFKESIEQMLEEYVPDPRVQETLIDPLNKLLSREKKYAYTAQGYMKAMRDFYNLKKAITDYLVFRHGSTLLQDEADREAFIEAFLYSPNKAATHKLLNDIGIPVSVL